MPICRCGHGDRELADTGNADTGNIELKPESADTKPEIQKKRRTRLSRPFPAAAFEEALDLAQKLFKVGSGQPVRRLTLFDHLGKAPESGPSRTLITNAGRYGLISGSYAAEHLELTEDGLMAVDEGVAKREQARARVRLAIERVDPFKQLYERFKNSRLPARGVLIDALKDLSVPADFLEEGVDTFIVNLRFVGLLQTLSGADRIITIDHLLDSVPATTPGRQMGPSQPHYRKILPIGQIAMILSLRIMPIFRRHAFTSLRSEMMAPSTGNTPIFS